MPHSTLDIKEVARLLGLDARDAARMAQRGQIPCRKVGGDFLFNRAEIIEWLQQRVGDMAHEHLIDVDQAMGQHRDTAEHEPVLAELLHRAGVTPALQARTKGSVLRALVDLADATGLLWDAEGLLAAVEEREDLCATALEGGIAIPHPRRPLPYSAAQPLLVVARTTSGIPFGAPDGRLTDLFFFTCSQDDRHHLHVLARLCRIVRDDSVVTRLRAAQTAEEMIDAIRQAESVLIGQPD
jgi:PTS system nitrogen regulatory IIA component